MDAMLYLEFIFSILTVVVLFLWPIGCSVIFHCICKVRKLEKQLKQIQEDSRPKETGKSIDDN